MPPTFGEIGEEEDDTLVLLFMCCHPALTPPSAIALTLRAVGGLTTAEIANAFLVPEATMAQRISRAKQTIKSSKVPLQMPTDAERAERLSAVLHVLYLIFNEGYASSSGDELQRTDLSNEAIRLTRVLHALLAERRRSRRTARADAAHRRAPRGAHRAGGRADSARRAGPVALGPRADRRRRRARSRALSSGAVGAVSAAGRDRGGARRGARAPRTPTGRRFSRCIGVLERMSDNPMVSLNRAIAAAMVHGPAEGSSARRAR